MRAKYLNQDPDRSQPEEISDVIGEVLEKVSSGADARHGAIVEDWATFAPGDWAAARPVGDKDGVLLVHAGDGAAASLLKYQIAPLIAAIDEHLGAGLVTGVRVSVDRSPTARNAR